MVDLKEILREISDGNKKLIEILTKMKNEGYEIILLSSASSFMLKHKIKWCEENCSFKFSDYVSISIDCPKCEYIQQYMKNNDITDAIFIDDSSSERAKAEEIMHLNIYSPQYFCN